MFKYEIARAPFGTLSKQGQHTRNWRGRTSLEAFSAEFNLLIRGTQDGPLPAQVRAMERLLADSRSIKAHASAPMFDLHAEAGFAMDRIAGDAARIWELLNPELLEVCDQSYYGDGRICIMLIFESRLEPDFAPAIENADGRFVSALSGT